MSKFLLKRIETAKNGKECSKRSGYDVGTVCEPTCREGAQHNHAENFEGRQCDEAEKDLLRKNVDPTCVTADPAICLIFPLAVRAGTNHVIENP